MSIFKSTFKDYIKKQFKVREEARNETGRTQPKNIQYLNSRTGWIRLTSTVDIDPKSDLYHKLGKLGGNQLAKKYILQGGTLYERNNELTLRRGLGSKGGAYGDKRLGGPNESWSEGGRQELGIRPMPGIISMNLKSKSAYGSLREATINIQCWSMSQLEELELLFMRPGYHLLLEWGSSLYLDNSGNLVTNPPKYINILDINNQKLSQTGVYDEIFKRIEESFGNYDAMYGSIKNFTWTSRPDGGYDCIIYLVSIGEVIESIKLNYATVDTQLVPFNLNKTDKNNNVIIPSNDGKNILEKYEQNKLEGILLYIQKVLSVGSKGINRVTYPLYISELKKLIETECLVYNFISKNSSSKTNSNNSNPETYIPLKFLVLLLNQFILPWDLKNQEPYVKLSVDDEKGKPLECFSYYKQASINPEICLISPFQNDLKNSSGQLICPDFIFLNQENKFFKDKNTGIIGNIYLSINNLINNMNSISKASEKGIVDLVSFFELILSQVQKSIGNINNFSLHVESNVIKIIDIQFLEGKALTVQNTSILKVFGNDTTVRDYSMQSSIFPSMMNLIAISAQANGSVLGLNNSTFVKFNEGLLNRITTEVGENKIEDPQLSISTNNPPQTFANPFTRNVIPNNIPQINAVNSFNKENSALVEFFKALNNKENRVIATSDVIEDLQNALHDVIYYEINNEEKDDSKYKGVLPIKISINMDGIGGLTIAEVFQIPDDRLPLGYKSSGGFKVGFIVTEIEQSIENNDWTTKLGAQTVILKK